MLDEQFKKQRARLVRQLAEKADPFIKQRLLGLAERYEGAEWPARPDTHSDIERPGPHRFEPER